MNLGSVVDDRFELCANAGSGAMGVVFRARDRASGHDVALKILRPQLGELTERFAREAQILSALAHPAIVRYVAHGLAPTGESFLAMEWLEGETLTARFKRTPTLPMEDALRVAMQVADALYAAHQRGIVHRDVKPGNIVLEGRDLGRVRLLDFGIARLESASRELTMTGVMLGTPGYMAPEQARGQRDIDARADIFALGCLLYRSLVGRTPFVSDEAMSVLLKVVLQDAPRLASLRPDLPPALDALVARMLSRKRDDRPADGGAALAELRAIVTTPVVDNPPSSIGSPSLTTTERRVTCLVLAANASRPGLSGTVVSGREQDRRESALRVAAGEHGGELEALADGSFMVSLTAAAVATDLAARAARCALAMRRVLPGLPMAIVTGRAEDVPGSIGELVEQGVHRVRYEDAAGVRLDDTTAGLLGSRFDVGGDALGLFLRGERDQTDLARTLLGKETPCVGRERELALLLGLWDESVAEPLAQAAVISGPPGVGKSRLRDELVRRLRERKDVEVWLGRGDALGAGAPFAMVGEAVRRAAGITPGEAEIVARKKLRARVARFVRPSEVERVSEFLGELAGVLFSDEGSVHLAAARRDPVLRADQMRRAFEDFVDAECAAHPLLLVLEDLHWGDRPSVDYVDGLLRALPERPLLVLAVGRPELRTQLPGLWSGRRTQELRLGELTRKAAETLSREVLGAEADESLISLVVERSGGNPFYLEELLRAAREGKTELLPATVVAMVQARLERLPEDARRVLRAASVFGRRFWQGGVLSLLGPRDKAQGIGDALRELATRELIVEATASAFPGERELAFRQALVREAAYAMLTDRDKQLGHRLAARWLERAGETNAVVMAEHLERGGNPARSADWYTRAAEQALAANDFSGAIARIDQAIVCGAQGEALGALLVLQAEVHRWRGANGAAANAGRLAMRELRAGSPKWFEAAGQVAAAAGKVGDDALLLHVVEELRAPALTSSAELTHSALVAAARAAVPLLAAGRYDLLEGLLAPYMGDDAAKAARDRATFAWLQRARSYAEWARGDIAAYLATSQAAERAFLEMGDQRNACSLQIGIGIGALEAGAHELAARALGDALAIAERMDLAHSAAVARHHLASVRARTGALVAARGLEQRAAEAFSELADARLEGAARASLARLSFLLRELADAEREAERAVELLADAPSLAPYAYAALAEVRLGQGRAAEALTAAERAHQGLSEAKRIETGEAFVRRMLAEARHLVGDESGAARAIGEAHAALLERAARISDEALRASFLERVPDHARTLGLAEEWQGAAAD
jgi:predicted Ser/Thr protein kinase